MPDLTDDLAVSTDRRRRVGMVAAAVAVPAVLMAVGSTGRLELGYLLIALVFPALFVYGQIHGRRTREGVDERAREHHRRAAGFSWQLMALLLAGTTVWMQVRHGTRAAGPYLVLTVALAGSYTAALLWHRRRG